MTELTKRLITGSILVAAIVAAIRWSPSLFAGIFAVLCMVGLYEFERLLRKAGRKTYTPMFLLGGMSLYMVLAVPQWLPDDMYLPLWTITLPFIVPALQRLISSPLGDGSSETLAAQVLIALPFGLLNLFSFPYELLMGFFILLWTHDSMAYVTGKLIGKNKLAPGISPGKTWEGSIGGLVFAIIAGIIIQHFYGGDLAFWILAGVVVTLGSTIGDLGISMIKRVAKVKDSGNILPGHGGVLDRMDGVLIAAPMFYGLLTLWLKA